MEKKSEAKAVVQIPVEEEEEEEDLEGEIETWMEGRNRRLAGG